MAMLSSMLEEGRRRAGLVQARSGRSSVLQEPQVHGSLVLATPGDRHRCASTTCPISEDPGGRLDVGSAGTPMRAPAALTSLQCGRCANAADQWPERLPCPARTPRARGSSDR